MLPGTAVGGYLLFDFVEGLRHGHDLNSALASAISGNETLLAFACYSALWQAWLPRVYVVCGFQFAVFFVPPLPFVVARPSLSSYMRPPARMFIRALARVVAWCARADVPCNKSGVAEEYRVVHTEESCCSGQQVRDLME